MSDDQQMHLCGDPNCADYWIECATCGCEFCSKCHPNSLLCPECAEQAAMDIDDEEPIPDFDDVPNLDVLIDELDKGGEKA